MIDLVNTEKSANAAVIRLGVVGLRNIGMNHVRRATALEDIEVVAVSDVDAERVEAAKTEFGIDTGYTEMRELFADERIDGVVLALPNPLHRAASIEAMEAGRHVLVEKPVASFVQDAQAMIEARDRTGKTLMVGYNQRFAGSV